MEMIPLFYPAIHKEEWLRALGGTFSTKYIAQADEVEAFEREFAEKFDYQYQYPVSVNSGSSALELAYHLLNLGPGDEVIGPVITCIATYLPLLRRGVTVRLVDVEKETMTIDPTKINITHKTKAIIPVNLGGLFCSDFVYALSKNYDVPMVVDACQTVGMRNNHITDFIAYSFQAIKHFTTGDGGMLICNNPKNYRKAKKLRWFGIDREARTKGGYKAYEGRKMTMDVEEPGYKFQMNDIVAALGRVSLKHSDEMLNHRKKIAKIYDKMAVPHIRGGTHWLYAILPENREEVANYLKTKGIETNLVHVRCDEYACMGGRIKAPNMDWLEKRYLYIPMHQNITIEEAKYVRDCVNEVVL